ncbi:hypothetical protein A5764_20885 [Mycobacterium sp. 852002-51057_SCH5723018]|nr:hypothetical protein A5764_20885 [Mycobacterium sp. 852002-51057_SCH5723018]
MATPPDSSVAAMVPFRVCLFMDLFPFGEEWILCPGGRAAVPDHLRILHTACEILAFTRLALARRSVSPAPVGPHCWA